jgi:hypothetical protein
MLDAATVPDQAHNQGNRDRGHDDDHQWSPRGDSASSVTPLEVHGEGNRDMHDIIHSRDVRGRIKSRHRDHERDELEQHDERDRDYYGPYDDQPH